MKKFLLLSGLFTAAISYLFLYSLEQQKHKFDPNNLPEDFMYSLTIEEIQQIPLQKEYTKTDEKYAQVQNH